jgi:hypothetical protein
MAKQNVQAGSRRPRKRRKHEDGHPRVAISKLKKKVGELPKLLIADKRCPATVKSGKLEG